MAATAWAEVAVLCECGCGQLAQDAHHIIDRRKRPDFAFGNLEALTHSCHSRITRARQLGIVEINKAAANAPPTTTGDDMRLAT